MSARAAPTREGDPRCPRCGTALATPTACPRCDAPPGWQPENPRRPSPLAGLGASFEGIRYVLANPRLITWILLPLIVNTALFVGLVIWLDGSLAAFVPDFESEWAGWIDWLRVGLRDLGVATLLRWICALVGLLAGFLATLLLSGIVNAPFYDVLSERVESVYLGRNDPGRGWLALPADTFRSIGAAVSLALRQLLVLGVLFLLSFVVVGAPLFAAAGFYFTGLALVDVTLSRKLYPGRVRARWARRHLLSLMAVGLPVSFVPPLAPFGIVGATLLFLRDPDKP
ncbi:MAG: hypothetical protein DHS20C15_18670 [Planctomycetota bacterium]|nr:MAG: hypothetical protein DHS20C15_18670 [Planctomycetota bacterium]